MKKKFNICVDGKNKICRSADDFKTVLTLACSGPEHRELQNEIIRLYDDGILDELCQEFNIAKGDDSGIMFTLEQLSAALGTPFNPEAVELKYSDYAEFLDKYSIIVNRKPSPLKSGDCATLIHNGEAILRLAFNIKESVLDYLPLVLNGSTHKLPLNAVGEIYVDIPLPEGDLSGAVSCQGRQLFSIQKKRCREIRVKDVSFNIVFVGGGETSLCPLMDNELFRLAPKKRVGKRVAVDDFYIGETVVTQLLWKTVMDNNPSHFKGDNLPVENISWDDCQKFIARLRELTSLNFRLPTEAEWQFAASGGRRSTNTVYAGSDDIESVAWHDTYSTNPVGKKTPNQLGIYDMSGNVSEWCADLDHSFDNQASGSPSPAVGDAFKACRGGGGFNTAKFRCAVNYRDFNAVTMRHCHLGLRLAISPEEIAGSGHSLEEGGEH